ncbi:hypothetical protein [Dyadobacter pollutisoli]|uniref:Uncharacterized protein n=1 Tax=Dyadobacter pollutisoli TaxID=2910158 RepID=A0A9E8NFQ6_9BACT|nr:hypothetical protein [Dyadobacter pollutisoli]WAC13269.1 hypothetical protein ON006_04750 [Dyadobacter pollutisoli]
MIEKHRTIEWLDFILTTVLNTAQTDATALTAQQLQTLIGKAHQEKLSYISFLKGQNLRLSGRRKLLHLIDQQHGKLLILLDQAYENAALIQIPDPMIISAIDSISCCIYELLTFMESRMDIYISLDDPAGPAYVSHAQKELGGHIDLIRADLLSHTDNQILTDIVLRSMVDISQEPGQRAITFREIFYKKELLKELEKISRISDQRKAHDAIVELLVYMNFNSRSFINYFTQTLARRINSSGSAREKMTQLLHSYKEFKQMHKKSGVRLHPYQADVKKAIGDWFTQEINYLEKMCQWDIAGHLQGSTAISQQKPEPFKVMVLLSVDQIGLILRALDSVRILKAKSLNAVFESITPFLSTPRKPEISWESMRSKSYTFEEKDKQTVIKILQTVIDWINEY